MSTNNPKLLSAYNLNGLELRNRVVMAPMTRSRAIGNVPNELMAEYYAQRATAGLIITEGVAPTPDALGYARIPGLYSKEQITGWKNVTDAVHASGGKIFVQLMHTGRVSHPLNMPEGSRVIAPSPIAASTTQMWTDQQQMQPLPVPEEITDIPALIGEYVHSAKSAIEAGFDGVEIHAANGYLPNQFLNPASNQRTDNYGGSAANRNRFVLELAQAVADAIGNDKTGIRLSPYNPFNDMDAKAEGIAEQYIALGEGLAKTGLAYVHFLASSDEIIAAYRKHFNTIILNGGYTPARAEADIASGKADLVSFGSSYIANPDLVARIAADADLAVPDQHTFYTADEKGYTDYPALQAV